MFEILLIPPPQQILVWTCVCVFICTSIITLLGIVNLIKIDPVFLNRLFITLILEIITIGVLAFKDSFTPPTIVEFVKITNPANDFKIVNNNSLFVDGAYNKSENEEIKAYLINSKTIPLNNTSGKSSIFHTVIDPSKFEEYNSNRIVLKILNGTKIVTADSIFIQR